MSEFNLNNLVLDDNSFDVLPDGDYHFKVDSHSIEFAQSEKLPPNTQQIVCYLEIPFEDNGEIKTVTVKNRLNVYKKALFAIRQFAECIGLCPEKGKFAFNVDKIDGLEINEGVSMTAEALKKEVSSESFNSSDDSAWTL
jgi:hypothetical protein